MKNNYGSNIQFVGERQGTEKHIKYKWVASANEGYPDTIFINKDDKFWFKLGDKRMTRFLRHIFSHEPIHCILYDMGIYSTYDYLVHKFRKQIKKECPKSFKEWNTF